jgi:hypothetical protein
MLTSLQGYGQISVKQLFKEFAGVEGSTKMNIGRFAMTLSGWFTETMGVHGIEVISLDACDHRTKARFNTAVNKLKDPDYETMIQANSKGERVKIMVKIKNETIRELVIVSSGNDSALIRIKGKIKPSDVEKVVAQNKNGC